MVPLGASVMIRNLPEQPQDWNGVTGLLAA